MEGFRLSPSASFRKKYPCAARNITADIELIRPERINLASALPVAMDVFGKHAKWRDGADLVTVFNWSKQ